ncbi:MAG: aspartate carbamoyltransferase catalytic subunit [Gammaproteobacteria bacterium]|nr:aspartate carbamoyltransferase catalytic subunit [Gammaproteobacteria bacterium]
MSTLGLRHLLDIESLSLDVIFQILNAGNEYLNKSHWKNQSKADSKILCNAFFESSTRTRCSFELAAKRLGIEVINFDVSTSSTLKGESLLDTFRALTAMKIDAFVVRHHEVGIPKFLAENLPPTISIINAGDGHHAHPTQALLDVMTIQQHNPNFMTLSIAIVGDISHSRVARSQIALFRKLGIKDIRLIAPAALIPSEFIGKEFSQFSQLNEGLQDVDVIIVLRIQKERMQDADMPNFSDYFQHYGIKPENLLHAKKGAIVMHPGPINREIDIASQVADGSQSVILKQITNGVAIRMAVLNHFLQ